MVKNSGIGGKKHKRTASKNTDSSSRLLEYCEDGQTYAKITKKHGDGRFECQCQDRPKPRLGKICGKMRKRVYVSIGDYVMVSLRDFQDDKCDIIHKYNDQEVKSLRKFGEIIEADETEREADEGFVFSYEQQSSVVEPQPTLEKISDEEEIDIDNI